jgi:hypothetical protein
VTLGNGSAHVELESFGGTIALRRPGEPRPETERRRTRERDNDQAADHGIDRALQQEAFAAVQGIDIEQVVDEAMAALPFPHPHPAPRPR